MSLNQFDNELNEGQVLAACKYLREAVEARRDDVSFDITPALCEIANTTERCIDEAGQRALEWRVDCLAHITWRAIADYELAGALHDGGVFSRDDQEWVCPFRGNRFEDALQLMREEEARCACDAKSK